MKRTARRFSLCADDAEDAVQRGLEILLRKAPTDDPRQLIKWLQTVVRHEALAIRSERERTLAGPAAARPGWEEGDWIAHLPTDADGPPEQAERREAVARSREALRTLKPQELRALTLLAEGYSYAEISEITGYSQTKINRSLAEGRERFRSFLSRSESGGRCRELEPLLSAFCDGETKPDEVTELREHLRACSHCRATLRAYRATPGAAAALAPLLPLRSSLWERVRDAWGEFLGRFGGGDGPATQAAIGSGGGGMVAAAKVAVVCVAAAGGAAGCVAGGIAPNPLSSSPGHVSPEPESQLSEVPVAEAPQSEESPQPEPERKPKAHTEPQHDSTLPAAAEAEPVATESTPVEPVTEYVPPPEPEPTPEPAPIPSSGGGSPAGEFGP